jgi:hypothetical protein
MRTPKERIAQGIEKAVENGREATPVAEGDGGHAVRTARDRSSGNPLHVRPARDAGDWKTRAVLWVRAPGCVAPGAQGRVQGVPERPVTSELDVRVGPARGDCGGRYGAGAHDRGGDEHVVDDEPQGDRYSGGRHTGSGTAGREVRGSRERDAVKAAAPFKITRFVYAPVDRRKVLKGELATPAMVDAYSALLKSKKALTATEAAKKAKRPQEANRRCLNLLVENGLVEKSALE